MWISATAHSITLTVFPIPVRFKRVLTLTATKHGLEKTSVKPFCQERMKNNTSALTYSLRTIRHSLFVYSIKLHYCTCSLVLTTNKSPRPTCCLFCSIYVNITISYPLFPAVCRDKRLVNQIPF